MADKEKRKFMRERRAQLAANAEAANAKNAEMTQQMRDQRALQRPPDVRGNDRVLFPRARHELDQLLPNIAMDVEGFGDMTAQERGAAVAKGMGRFLQPIMGAAGDVVGAGKAVGGPVVRGALGFVNPAAAAVTGSPSLGDQPANGKEQSADQQGTQDIRPGDQSLIPGAPQMSGVSSPGLTPFGDPTGDPAQPLTQFGNPRRIPPPPPQTLTSSAGNTFPTGGGTGGGAFNPQEDAVPEDFVEIIRGTDRTYSQQQDGRFGREFRALPGMSLQESQKAAAAESPGFQFLQEQDIERQRVNAQTINAEANMTQALYSNSVTGYDDNGYPSVMLPRQDRSGYDKAAGISPVLAQAASEIGRFTWQETTGPDGMPILVMGDSSTGQTNNVTLEQGLAVGFMALDNWGRSEGYGNFADIPQDELDDFIDELALAPSVEAALRQQVNNSPARQGR